ncbi:helix-turn-helix domain-containing protein [Roseobacter sp. YSTF-M11]|uniref:Helix-turn-helix domain-containing protein n=1 Tax=Roseobacter insulae TaxID=2859783 RepID=A0A9X1FVJ3_9RHOB|nr:helix-turn-helix domain-containing protein [Roseobacter insulae]MBW4708453.1 helix-turn-helix domain-containing protein [Roseobacter insulae]
MQTENILRTTLLVLEDTNTLSFAAAVDPMRAANRHAGRSVFDWRFATPGAADVTLTSGLSVPASPLHLTAACDLLIIVAGFSLEVQATPALRASLRRLAATARFVAGIDGGPWIMARAGLLDGYRATTHWEDLGAFATTFPNVITSDARFVDSGNRLTSGGAAPAIDMMLHLISDLFGPGLSDRVAGSFIYDANTVPARPQSRRKLRVQHSPITARVDAIMQAHLEDPVSIRDLARTLGISQRALQMHFQTRLGITPQAHYLDLRLSEADRLVTETGAALHDVALSTGFASQSSFARAYTRRFGSSARKRRADQIRVNTA